MPIRTPIYWIAALLWILATACSSPQPDDGPTSWQELLEQREGTLHLYYVPSGGFSYTDEQDSLTGVTIELMRDFVRFVERAEQVELHVKPIAIESFTGFYNTVLHAQPGAFGVGNVTITEQRKENIGFSPPYLTNIAVIITNSGVPGISEREQIAEKWPGLNALAFEGTLHENRAREIVSAYLPSASIQMASSNDEIIERIAEDVSLFAPIDIYNYWRAAAEGEPLKRHPPFDTSSEQFGVIFPKSSDWADALDRFFEADGGYVHSDRYHTILRAHLGEELAELLIENL